MLEDFSREQKVHGSSDRSFGIIMAAFFGIVALFPLLHAPLSSIRWWALALAVALLASALLWTAPLRPLNRLWLKLGLLLSKVVSPIVLMVLFYATVTPIGLLMRATGKDPLRLHRDVAAASYWIARRPPGPAPDSMKHQF
jgi:membrane protease YdiL (CAAX protease family)